MGSTAGHQEEAIVVCVDHDVGHDVGRGVTGRARSTRTTNDAAPQPSRIVRRSNGTENNIFSSRKRRAWVALADQRCFWREARSTSGVLQYLEAIYIASV